MKIVKMPSADNPSRYHLLFLCPGCERNHRINETWRWNGSLDKPTLTPSILATTGPNDMGIPEVCHSYITDGRIQFLNDSKHKLAGQTVDLPDFKF